MTLRRRLTDDDVRRIVTDSVDLIKKAQSQLHVPITPNITQTRTRLNKGSFKALRLNKRRESKFEMEYGSFVPPSTIILDMNLPSSDHPMHMPDFTETLTTYSAVHEIVHADDHTGGDRLLLETRSHILREHKDKLRKSMKIIQSDGGCNAIECYEDLASLWAVQYLEMVTHYRSYVVLRQLNYPRIDHLWGRLRSDYFPPNLLTCIEAEKGIDYVFKLFTERIGEYCLIEALDEYKRIKEKATLAYTV